LECTPNYIIKYYLNTSLSDSVFQRNNFKMAYNNQTGKTLEELNIKPTLAILHFNDVYDIQTKKGAGGVCNFKAKLDDFREVYG
jgi:hypothetical protein